MPRHPTVVWCWNLRRVPTTTCAPETTTSQIAAKREDFLSKPQIQPAVNASSHGLELCCDLTSQFLYHEVYMLPSYSIVGRVFLLEFTWFSITYITYVWFSISFIFLVNLNSAVGIVFLINNYLLKSGSNEKCFSSDANSWPPISIKLYSYYTIIQTLFIYHCIAGN